MMHTALRVVALIGWLAAGSFVQLRAAEPPQSPARLRVLTYNIHHGEGTDHKLDLERTAAIIRAAKPDLVAVQEIERNTQRTGKVDQPAELARLTGLEGMFGGNIPFAGGEYGNAVLSRLPIRRHKNHPLPSLGEGEKRGVLEVEVELAGGESLTLYATHLDHRRPDAERLAQAQAINELVAAKAPRRAILAGDLNAVPDSPTLGVFSRQWAVGDREPLLTSPAGRPVRQIDYVLPLISGGLRVVEMRVLDEPVASDHRPLLVTFEVEPRPSGEK
jgi:endonuclease/exonuclease/phosphatase family metal-dependent hydrolase